MFLHHPVQIRKREGVYWLLSPDATGGTLPDGCKGLWQGGLRRLQETASPESVQIYVSEKFVDSLPIGRNITGLVIAGAYANAMRGTRDATIMMWGSKSDLAISRR